MPRRRRKFVVDTTYILPFFGIEVEGISEDLVIDLADECDLVYPEMLLAELWAKVLREARKRGLNQIPKEASIALGALLLGSGIELAPPNLKQRK